MPCSSCEFKIKKTKIKTAICIHQHGNGRRTGKSRRRTEQSIRFGSARDLEHLYELRAMADSVMCGARTIEISQSILGTGGGKISQAATEERLAEYNLRVIVSGSGSINPQAAIFQKRVFRRS